jgi:hypothetical protein
MSSRTRLCFALAALTALMVGAAAPRAHACSPLPPGVSGTIPAEGEKYPGNAAIIVQGQGISLTDASVTVDGQPATLKDVSKTQFGDTGFFGVMVEPAPTAGQNVVISGTFCPAGSGCPMVTLHYQATEAKISAGVGIATVAVNVLDYADFKSSGGDCQSDSDFAWFVHAKPLGMDPATDGVRIYSIEGYSDITLTGPPLVRAVGIVKDASDLTVTIRGTTSTIQGKPLPEALCFTTRSYPVAGNGPAETGIVCKPCNYRVDAAPNQGSPPVEPLWTAADVYPGGPCDTSMTYSDVASGATGTGYGSSSGAGGGDGGDQVVDGCGCRVAGDRAPASGLASALGFALGAALLRARRRR